MKRRSIARSRGLATAMAIGLSLLGIGVVRGSENGGLRGRVVDSTNLPLPDAFVRVNPGDVNVVTDREGNYSVTNLAPGSYKVGFSYLGFISVTQDATVTAGSPLRLDATLKPALNIAEQVEVTASRSRGEVEALNQEKNADGIVDVLPAEIITSLPNANVADAIGRLPSVSLERDEGEGKYVQVRGLQPAYTNVTIDGVHVGASELAGGGRAVKLDDVPADLVGSIELYKTLSADQDADAIGGSVNLVTKQATDSMHFSVGTQQGYTFLEGGRYVTTETGTYSNRFGTDKAFGLVLGGSWDYNGRGIDDLEPAPTYISLPNGATVPGLPTADYREYAYDRERWGFAGGLDYRIDQNSDLFIHGLFSQFYNYGVRWVGTPTAGNFITPTLTDNTGTFNKSVQNRTPNEQIGSISAGGKHNLQSVFIDYRFAYSHTRQNTNNEYTASFNGPQNVAYSIDDSNPSFPKFNITNGVNINDPSLYSFNQFQIANEKTHLNSYEGAVNIAIPFNIGTSASTFKFGGKYREDDRINQFSDESFSANGTNLTLSQVLDPFTNPNYYFGM
jgi:TonB-dependent receptor